jgi:hypothetical protein
LGTCSDSGATGAGAPAPESYFRALLDYGGAARWGKRPLTRQTAREQLALR